MNRVEAEQQQSLFPSPVANNSVFSSGLTLREALKRAPTVGKPHPAYSISNLGFYRTFWDKSEGKQGIKRKWETR